MEPTRETRRIRVLENYRAARKQGNLAITFYLLMNLSLAFKSVEA